MYLATWQLDTHQSRFFPPHSTFSDLLGYTVRKENRQIASHTMSLLLRCMTTIATVPGGLSRHANHFRASSIKSSTFLTAFCHSSIKVSRSPCGPCRAHRAHATSDLDQTSFSPFKLIIYSKDECPLCDKLKDKVRAILDRANFSPSSPFSGVEVEIRDIKSNAQWEAAYSLSIPVLAFEKLNDNVEVCLLP